MNRIRIGIGIKKKKLRIEEKTIKIIPAVACLVSLLITGCGAKNKINTSTIFAMDTVMQLEIQGDEELLREAENHIRDIESELSVTSSDSEIGKINSDKSGKLSEDGTKILKEALKICDMTEGSLDISVYPVLKEWGFTTGEYRVPSDDELKELVANVGFNRIGAEYASDEECNVSIEDNMQIDLGSVVKGYTGSDVAAFFREKGVTSGLINLGGNVECIGTKPNGKPWRVAVKSPFEDSKSDVLGVLEASDTAVITSGGYERFFEENGEKYWHIIDPKTGKPAKSGLISVTVIGKNGTVCDGLSTALFVMGKEGAEEFYKKYGSGENGIDAFELIMVSDDKKVYLTEGVNTMFSLAPEYSDLQVEVIG